MHLIYTTIQKDGSSEIASPSYGFRQTDFGM